MHDVSSVVLSLFKVRVTRFTMERITLNEFISLLLQRKKDYSIAYHIRVSNCIKYYCRHIKNIDLQLLSM